MTRSWRARVAAVTRLLGPLAVLVGLPAVAAARECVDLPTPAIKISRPSQEEVRLRVVSSDEMAEIAKTSGMKGSPHPLIAISETLDAHFVLSDPVVKGSPGQFCAAPEAVTISLGVFRRTVVITREAAADACVKGVLLYHENEHYRILNSALDTFLQQRQNQIRQVYAKAKTGAASGPEAAIKKLKIDLVTFLNGMVSEFKEQDLSGIRRAADTVENLAAMRNACGGRVRELEEQLSREEDLR